jgi:hypothetical protein
MPFYRVPSVWKYLDLKRQYGQCAAAVFKDLAQTHVDTTDDGMKIGQENPVSLATW